MNEELKGVLLDLLQKMVAGVDFAIEQAPDVLQQFIRIRTWIECGTVLLSVIALVGGIALCIYATKVLYEKDSTQGEVLFWLSAAVALAGFVVALTNAAPALTVLFAPKVYLLQYLNILK